MSVGGHSLHKKDYLELGLGAAALSAPWTLPAAGAALGIGAPAAASDAALMAMDPTGAAAFEGASNPSGGAGLLSRIASNKATPQMLGILGRMAGGAPMPPPVPPMRPMGIRPPQPGAQITPYAPLQAPSVAPSLSTMDPQVLAMLTPDQLRQLFSQQQGGFA